MRATIANDRANRVQPLLLTMAVAAASLLATNAHAAAPGITGTTFNLDAKAAYITQPDGASIYSWGFGCNPDAGQRLCTCRHGRHLSRHAAARPHPHSQ